MTLTIVKEARAILRNIGVKFGSDDHVVPMVVICGVTADGTPKPLLCDADGKLILSS
jgi:hypothetical protein